mmetsp:Transcript_3043/g.12550  ORF Transcript_3043/g.12550 Transcript_3043/m.12550 type:complete len:240 (+) Transcript_3043:1024-1743(+)
MGTSAGGRVGPHRHLGAGPRRVRASPRARSARVLDPPGALPAAGHGSVQPGVRPRPQPRPQLRAGGGRWPGGGLPGGSRRLRRLPLRHRVPHVGHVPRRHPLPPLPRASLPPPHRRRRSRAQQGARQAHQGGRRLGRARLPMCQGAGRGVRAARGAVGRHRPAAAGLRPLRPAVVQPGAGLLAPPRPLPRPLQRQVSGRRHRPGAQDHRVPRSQQARPRRCRGRVLCRRPGQRRRGRRH